MKAFLIILAVLVVLFAIILSLSVRIKVKFDNGWNTKVKIVFKEFDVELSKLLSIILFPEKAGKQAAEERADKKKEAEEKKEEKQEEKAEDEIASDDSPKPSEEKPKKPNPIQKIWNDDGVLGIMLLVSNLLQTAGTAISTLYKGLHIHELYVNIIIGGGDAADIGHMYGTMCGIYYPIKGTIINGMRIDKYDDNIEADFIAPRSEYQFTLDASLNVRLVFRILIRSGVVFIKNFIKNK